MLSACLQTTVDYTGCPMQSLYNNKYVGQTSQYIKIRLKQHIQEIRNNKPVCAKHFISNKHQFDYTNYKIVD